MRERREIRSVKERREGNQRANGEEEKDSAEKGDCNSEVHTVGFSRNGIRARLGGIVFKQKEGKGALKEKFGDLKGDKPGFLFLLPNSACFSPTLTRIFPPQALALRKHLLAGIIDKNLVFLPSLSKG
ncbi:hypothetical protein SLEP1_g24459 [Rubroshorea leprosula]|uniref:Uncharacterized protein n=1 Tax=Rubroshorea leprosula TaxID=152421 RepID=A0AAV5JPJ2_9ROSI|nr:hypothetical protein SLEP1_g24459 [Rubroshorea leprosula]